MLKNAVTLSVTLPREDLIFLLFYKKILLNEIATSFNQRTVELLAMTVLIKVFSLSSGVAS